MRISDWSLDVCSSDLRVMQAVSRGDLDAAYRALKNYSVLPGDDVDRGLQASRQQRAAPLFAQRFGATVGSEFIGRKKLGQSMLRLTYIERTQRSDERSVGKECVSTCSSRWAATREKKKTR